MSFVIGFFVGALAGYLAAYFQHNPERRAELMDLFKKKPPTP